MYSKGSEACLDNSKRLLENARLLFNRSSYGSAQSLAISSIEEAGKTVILELADLGRVPKEAIKLTMKGSIAHSLKKIVAVGIQHYKFLIDKELLGESEEPITGDKVSIKKLLKDIKVSDLEARRQNGLYVNVDYKNGRITNDPARLNSEEVNLLIRQAQTYLASCNVVCKILTELKTRPSLSSFKIKRVDVPTMQQLHSGSREDDQTITIVFDEI
jgi:AbiV family abortive infection protein